MAWNEGYVTEIPYTPGFYHHLSPANLQLIPLLKQVNHQPITRPFNYCELACGLGITTNILAAAYPHAQFYGMDFNPTHILKARSIAEAAGLTNVNFSDKSFKEYAHEELPDFDYICLHGIYSWVSEENQQAIAQFIRKKLKIGGIVYISYNTMPGWAITAPIQRLMFAYNAKSQASAQKQLEGSLELLEKLKDSKALYLQNPGALRRLEQLRNFNRSYLIHEYFNQHWKPLYFDEVHRAMTAEKLTYLGSANLLDNMDNLNLPGEAIQELTKIDDLAYREVVRDFYLNSTFRRDVYIKGIEVMAPAKQIEILRSMKFTLAVQVENAKMEHQTSFGKLQLQENVYKPILEFLRDEGVASLDQLEQVMSSHNINLQRLIQAILVLIGMGYVYSMIDGIDPSSAQRFNSMAIQQSFEDDAINFLCSSIIGNGVNVNRLEQWFLAGEYDSSKGLDYIRQIVDRNNLKITREGKTAQTPEENWHFLKESAEAFAKNKRPILKRLGI